LLDALPAFLRFEVLLILSDILELSIQQLLIQGSLGGIAEQLGLHEQGSIQFIVAVWIKLIYVAEGIYRDDILIVYWLGVHQQMIVIQIVMAASLHSLACLRGKEEEVLLIQTGLHQQLVSLLDRQGSVVVILIHILACTHCLDQLNALIHVL
jgi:hypothetical protein